MHQTIDMVRMVWLAFFAVIGSVGLFVHETDGSESFTPSHEKRWCYYA